MTVSAPDFIAPVAPASSVGQFIFAGRTVEFVTSVRDFDNFAVRVRRADGRDDFAVLVESDSSEEAAAALTSAVADRIWEGLRLRPDIHVIVKGQLPRTTSGKLIRSRCADLLGRSADGAPSA